MKNHPQPGIPPNVDKNQIAPAIIKITAKAIKIVAIFSAVSDIVLHLISPSIWCLRLTFPLNKLRCIRQT